MKICCFSDMSDAKFGFLCDVVLSLGSVDVLVYAGSNARSFLKGQKQKLLSKMLKKSRFGMVISEGDLKILPKGWVDVALHPLVVDECVFVGIARKKQSDAEFVCNELSRAAVSFSEKKLAVVSFREPFGVLDVGLVRGRVGHDGSYGLRNFLDGFEKETVVFGGHGRFQGGQSEGFGKSLVVNCCSTGDELGKLGVIEDGVVSWNYVYEGGVLSSELEELMGVPFIGVSRAVALVEMGICSIKQLADSVDVFDADKYEFFPENDFVLARNFAKAICAKKPLVAKSHSFDARGRKVWFFDAEFVNGVHERIFLLGCIDESGVKKTWLLRRGESEKKMLQSFVGWLRSENPVLVSYGSLASDVPQLECTFRRCGIRFENLKEYMFDVFVDSVNSQSVRKQWLYLPVRKSLSEEKSMGLKKISELLGYVEEGDFETSSGFEALIEYEHYLSCGDEKILFDLVRYNESDLYRTKFVFEKVRELMQK